MFDPGGYRWPGLTLGIVVETGVGVCWRFKLPVSVCGGFRLVFDTVKLLVAGVVVGGPGGGSPVACIVRVPLGAPKDMVAREINCC